MVTRVEGRLSTADLRARKLDLESGLAQKASRVRDCPWKEEITQARREELYPHERPSLDARHPVEHPARSGIMRRRDDDRDARQDRVARLVDHVEHVRVSWADTDAGGRIHFTAALRYAELAEIGLRRQLGLLGDWGDYPRRRVEAEYHRVLRFEDQVEVRIRAERVGRTSITWAWEMTRDEERCVDGRHVVVHVDGDGRASPLPDTLRQALM